MNIPAIRSKGKFGLKPPFDNIVSSMKEYTVTSIRSLTELGPEDPIENIYKLSGLTEDDYNLDKDNDVPIVVLSDTSGSFIYVPGNRFITVPIVTGIRHQESILSIPLGLLPVDIDLGLIKSNIEQMIYDTIGVDTSVTKVESSAIILVEDTDSKTMKLLRENRISVKKSYRTRYLETKELLDSKILYLEQLECYIKKTEGSQCQ